MPKHHHLASSPATCHWGFFDAALKPVLTVEPGDTVTVDCVSGGADALPGPPFEVLPEHRAIVERLRPPFGAGHILIVPHRGRQRRARRYAGQVPMAGRPSLPIPPTTSSIWITPSSSM